MTPMLLITTLATAAMAMTAQPSPGTPATVDVVRVWDAGRHNAFTDLVRWCDRWYLTFREGDDHVGGDGRIRVLVSDDGRSWASAALIGEDGVDLRDPKLSITPDDRLMIVAGGSVYEGTRLLGCQPRVAFSPDGRTWSAPARVLSEGEWLWRVTWHDGVAWGVSYNASTEPDWTVTLVASRDGIAWRRHATLQVPGRPNEATLRVMPDGEMLVLIRREGGDRVAWLGRSRAPYTTWHWGPTAHRIGGPNFIRLPDGRLWASGRGYGAQPTTVVATLTPEGRYEPVITLPSGGDTSYPGLVWHDGMLWVSYYSSHEERTSIYLARLRLP